MLTGKCVVLGVTGGIAAYKACEVVSRLRKLNARVRVVMTKSAREFVAPMTFEALSGNPVYSDTFARAFEIEHISLAKDADILVIAPATANILGKIACGIADDLLSTTYMAMAAPVLIAPAMNSAMWKSPANRQNVETLRARGVNFVGPASGKLACGDEDIGRMSEPEEIALEITKILTAKKDLLGRKILVTAGPTREMLDPVRFLSNRSSGKMGYAIAEEAVFRGAKVYLVTGPVLLAPPAGAEVISITSTAQLYDAVTKLAPDCDAVIQAAAPCDFTPEAVSGTKIKKTGEDMTLKLRATPDIAAQLGRDKTPGQVLVAFAAETGDLVANARKKLEKKRADLVVANDVTEPGAGFSGDTNRVTLVDHEGAEALPLMSKRAVAGKILDRVVRLWEAD